VTFTVTVPASGKSDQYSPSSSVFWVNVGKALDVATEAPTTGDPPAPTTLPLTMVLLLLPPPRLPPVDCCGLGPVALSQLHAGALSASASARVSASAPAAAVVPPMPNRLTQPA
jgi:hypothetical protein